MHMEHDHDCGHAHEHEHEHSHDHSHTDTPREELIALMRYMVGHNVSHTNELKNWRTSSPIPATARPAHKYSTQSMITKPAIRSSQKAWSSFRSKE